jgi:hypothetical protein
MWFASEVKTAAMLFANHSMHTRLSGNMMCGWSSCQRTHATSANSVPVAAARSVGLISQSPSWRRRDPMRDDEAVRRLQDIRTK